MFFLELRSPVMQYSRATCW